MLTGSPVEEAVETVNWPVAAPAVVGSNWTFIVTLWPELRVTGKVGPVIEYPVPLIVSELTVMGAKPVDVKVMDWTAGVFTVTSPNAKPVVLMVSALTSTPFVLTLAHPDRITGRVQARRSSNTERQRWVLSMRLQLRARCPLRRDQPLSENASRVANADSSEGRRGDLPTLKILVSFFIQTLRLRYRIARTVPHRQSSKEINE
jgi:hypothetical protein